MTLQSHTYQNEPGEEPEHFKNLTEVEKNSERYLWLINHGHSCRDSVVGTGSMSMGRGPYIFMDLPSMGIPQGLVLDAKQFADSVINSAIVRQARRKAAQEADEAAIKEWRKANGLQT